MALHKPCGYFLAPNCTQSTQSTLTSSEADFARALSRSKRILYGCTEFGYHPSRQLTVSRLDHVKKVVRIRSLSHPSIQRFSIALLVKRLQPGASMVTGRLRQAWLAAASSLDAVLAGLQSASP